MMFELKTQIDQAGTFGDLEGEHLYKGNTPRNPWKMMVNLRHG